MRRQAEKELRQQVIEYLESQGYLVVWTANELMRNRFKFNKGLIKGFPDLIVMGRAEIFFIELKAGKNKLTFAQDEVIGELRRRGFEVYIVRALDEVKNLIGYERGQKKGKKTNKD